MGCVKTIDYDKFPKQNKEGDFSVGSKVRVCFHYDTSKICMGTIVRDDLEEPCITIIRLDDGRYVLSTECQYGA
jgi:hypothetical protein